MVAPPRYYPLSAYYPLIKMLVCAFNVVLFALLSFYCIRDYRKRKTRWGGYIYAYIVVLCAIMFVAHLANDFSTEFAWHRFLFFDCFEITAKYLILPMVLHLFYCNEKEYLRRQMTWKICIGIVYAMAAAIGMAEMNVGVIHWFNRWPGWSIVRPLFRLLMMVVAAGSGLVLWTARLPNETPLSRKRRHWLIYVCAVWIGTLLAGTLLPEGLNEILEKVIPLCFIFVITYYVERFTFFDIVIKRGTFVFASLFLLGLYFVVVPPLLSRLGFHTWVGTLVWSFTVWPIALLAPWAHRALSSWVDRHFLGRRFSPAQATKYFVAGLQGAIDENELAREAESHLKTIFRSQAYVYLTSLASPAIHSDMEFMVAPIRLKGEVVGQLRVEGREQGAPFLSEDVALLASLADALAFLIENLRLREKRLQQEKREQELLLNANRSELKALRAQINPHFLFNALNTIAALISRQPKRAEQTVEELAEIFRYTLRRSDREWAQLDEELEAVRAYLHIEQARFGDELRFEIERNGETGNIRIPAMVVQTLVENSIKHGVASRSTGGFVEVRVDISQSNLRIEVRDNGQGFQHSVGRRTGSGYGLSNVEERLRRYFGEASKLTISRDTVRDMTLVSIDMPRVVQALGASAT